MHKFTVFTIILSIVVVIVAAEVIAENYLKDPVAAKGNLDLDLPSKIDFSGSLKTDANGAFSNRLGADLAPTLEIGESEEIGTPLSIEEMDAETNEDFQEELEGISDLDFLPLYDDAGDEIALGVSDFEDAEMADVKDVNGNEDEGNTAVSRNPTNQSGDFEDVNEDFENKSFSDAVSQVYLRDQQVWNAGFATASVEEEDFEGMLFKTVSAEGLPDTEVLQFLIKTSDALMAKVYVFNVGITAEVGEIYALIKQRAAEGLGVSINETNQFGSASFYMNDPRRENSAFLTVRFGKLIYAFSYPKKFHSQIKNLIQLLDWELGS